MTIVVQRRGACIVISETALDNDNCWQYFKQQAEQ